MGDEEGEAEEAEEDGKDAEGEEGREDDGKAWEELEEGLTVRPADCLGALVLLLSTFLF